MGQAGGRVKRYGWQRQGEQVAGQRDRGGKGGANRWRVSTLESGDACWADGGGGPHIMPT